jgi:hypothetical protein
MPGDSITDHDANFSLAVANKNLTENTSRFPRNISSWFLLESDVHGEVEDPSYYFDPSNTQRLRDLDLLLLTQGWRDFAWKYDTTYFPPENGFSISGRLRRSSANKALENSRVSIGIFGSKGKFLTTVPVDSSGTFMISGIDFTGQARLVVSGIGKKGHLQGKIILDSIFYKTPKLYDAISSDSVLLENKLTENKSTTLKTYFEINSSIRKKYKLSDTISLGEVKIISERKKDFQTLKIESSRIKYGRPESEVIITEQMQSYPSLIDILRGHVSGLVVTGNYPDYKIIIRGLSSISAQSRPMVLIDGLEALFEDLITMPIAAVDRIDVLKSFGSTSIFGLRGSNGVINIITRAEGMVYVPVEYSHNVKIKGYNASRIFYSPQHSSESNSEYEPDLRSTLLWEPDINLENHKDITLIYFNADNSSVITVIAEGITSTGIPVTGKAEYEVK